MVHDTGPFTTAWVFSTVGHNVPGSYLVHGHDVANIEVGCVIGTDGVPHEWGHLLAHRHAGPAGRDETGEKRQGLGKVAGAGNGTDTGAGMVTSTDASILTVAGLAR